MFVYLCTLIIAGVMILGCWFSKLPEFAQGLSYHQILYVHPLSRISEFALGMLTYQIFIRLQSRLSELRFLPASIFEAVVVCMLLFTAYFTKRVAYSFVDLPVAGETLRCWLQYCGLISLPVGLTILVFAFQRGFISRLLRQRSLIYLGELSFAFYLAHRMLLLYCTQQLSKFTGVIPFLVFLLVLLSVSQISCECVERPCQRWLKQKIRGRNSPTAGSRDRRTSVLKIFTLALSFLVTVSTWLGICGRR